MNDTFMKANGAVVYWTPAEATNLSVLNDALDRLALGEFKAQARTPFACLKDALAEHFRGRDFLIEALEQDGKNFGFEVVQVIRHEEENEYKKLHSFVMNAHLQMAMKPHDGGKATEIVLGFNRQLGLIKAAQLTEVMVKIVEHLGGTRLRPRGGIYWLPDSQVSEWRGIGKEIQAACAKGATTLYTLTVLKDEDAVRAVRDAITAEIEEQATAIMDDVMKGTLGERALDTRKSQAIELRKKIAMYEDLLETGLGALTALADKAELAAAEAALTLASAAA